MKNLFKLTFAAVVLATTVSACGGDGDKGNDTTTVVVDSNVKIDSNVRVDTIVRDTTAADTASKM